MALRGFKAFYALNGHFSQMLLALKNAPGNSLKLTMFLAKYLLRKNSQGWAEYNIYSFSAQKAPYCSMD